MAERVEDWWARRQFSRGREVPYDVGAYREAWAAYPLLVRQYHPELNAGIVLSQIPPAADVLLLWQCEAGHLFVATPSEQRSRPGGRRRRSAWCPECTAGAVPRRVAAPTRAAAGGAGSGMPGSGVSGSGASAAPQAAGRPRRARICAKTPDVPVGSAFVSACAPRPASAAEGALRAAVFSALAVTPGMNAVRVARPFFEHLEVWPDLLLPELRVAIEYDTVGRFGLEHVGPHEETDRRKDRLLRAAGWEVVRLRTGPLRPLGPHDITGATTSRRGIERLIDALRDIRGPLIVDAYRV
ncbi:zinc-ribbon domain-containing protein [Microbacterium fluvii]|uniref:Zinc-ribbon domain-containing protein n=1 Tax=Microbacterium fluvii TaxID=415215 RepID=A0ABW2HDJ1_9MICO|nr:zinc-ribbon domain-containing protein [Microbacterium fluvii]MCU4672924.1 zinc-ribbon domain-containing protein [Microbacterium fluvii]